MEGFTHCVWRGSGTVREGVHAPCVEGVHAPYVEGFTHRTWRGSRTVHGGFMHHAWGVHAPCVEGFTHRAWGVHAPYVGGSHTMRGGLRTSNVHHCLSLGYHWLPIATIDLVGNKREIEV